MLARIILNQMDQRFFSDAITMDEFESMKPAFIQVLSDVYKHRKDKITVALKNNASNVCVVNFYPQTENQKFVLNAVMEDESELINLLNDRFRLSKHPILRYQKVVNLSEPRYTGKLHIHLLFYIFEP